MTSEQGAAGGVADVLTAHGLFGHAHLVAALQSLLDAEVSRRVKAKVRLCARCGVREVVRVPGEMVCCDTCTVEVCDKVWTERVDAEVERLVDAEKATAWARGYMTADQDADPIEVARQNPYREGGA